MLSTAAHRWLTSSLKSMDAVGGTMAPDSLTYQCQLIGGAVTTRCADAPLQFDKGSCTGGGRVGAYGVFSAARAIFVFRYCAGTDMTPRLSTRCGRLHMTVSTRGVVRVVR